MLLKATWPTGRKSPFCTTSRPSTGESDQVRAFRSETSQPTAATRPRMTTQTSIALAAAPDSPRLGSAIRASPSQDRYLTLGTPTYGRLRSRPSQSRP